MHNKKYGKLKKNTNVEPNFSLVILEYKSRILLLLNDNNKYDFFRFKTENNGIDEIKEIIKTKTSCSLKIKTRGYLTERRSGLCYKIFTSKINDSDFSKICSLFDIKLFDFISLYQNDVEFDAVKICKIIYNKEMIILMSLSSIAILSIIIIFIIRVILKMVTDIEFLIEISVVTIISAITIGLVGNRKNG